MPYKSLAPSLAAAIPDTSAYSLSATVLKIDTSSADVQLADGSVLRRLKVAGGLTVVGATVDVEFSKGLAPVVIAQGGSSAQGSGVIFTTASGGSSGSSGVPVSRLVIAGLGLYGGGDLSGDITLNAGQGDGISIAADAIAVDSTVVRTTRQVIAGAGLTGGGALSANVTIDAAVANTGAAGLTVETDAIRLTSSSNPGTAASVLASSATGTLQLVALGAGIAPLYPVHSFSSNSSQLRVDYGSNKYADVWADSGGNLRLAPNNAAVIIQSDNFLPNMPYTGNIGLPNRKWLTLHVAEIQAEVLVAREKVVTMGGRQMIASSGMLIEDLPASA